MSIIGEKRTIALIPGAFGSKDPETVRWWFQHIIPVIEDAGLTALPLTYGRGTIGEIAAACVNQVVDPRELAGVVCYSMGRAVFGHMLPALSEQGATRLVCGQVACPPDGVFSWGAFRATLQAIPEALLTAFVRGEIVLGSWQQVCRFFLNTDPRSADADQIRWATELLEHCHAQPLLPALQVAVPSLGHRTPIADAVVRQHLLLLGGQDLVASQNTMSQCHDWPRTIVSVHTNRAAHAVILHQASAQAFARRLVREILNG